MHVSHQTVRSRRARADQNVMRWNVGGSTDAGIERERNEDQFLIAELGRELSIVNSSLTFAVSPSAGRSLVLAVADGMGGMGHGDLASAVTLETFVAYVAQSM